MILKDSWHTAGFTRCLDLRSSDAGAPGARLSTTLPTRYSYGYGSRAKHILNRTPDTPSLEILVTFPG